MSVHGSVAPRYRGQVALVTGAGSGIGAATAARLAAEGAHVILAVRCLAGLSGQAPDEVASAVAFRGSADASFVTGASLVVDGGWNVTADSA